MRCSPVQHELYLGELNPPGRQAQHDLDLDQVAGHRGKTTNNHVNVLLQCHLPFLPQALGARASAGSRLGHRSSSVSIGQTGHQDRPLPPHTTTNLQYVLQSLTVPYFLIGFLGLDQVVAGRGKNQQDESWGQGTRRKSPMENRGDKVSRRSSR